MTETTVSIGPEFISLLIMALFTPYLFIDSYLDFRFMPDQKNNELSEQKLAIYTIWNLENFFKFLQTLVRWLFGFLIILFIYSSISELPLESNGQVDVSIPFYITLIGKIDVDIGICLLGGVGFLYGYGQHKLRRRSNKRLEKK